MYYTILYKTNYTILYYIIPYYTSVKDLFLPSIQAKTQP